jgi:hypothetical protein
MTGMFSELLPHLAQGRQVMALRVGAKRHRRGPPGPWPWREALLALVLSGSEG